MKIAVLGAGPIGSTFAFHLARAGHDVTVIARGERLAQLRAEGAVVTWDKLRADVQVGPALDPAVDYDLVLVAVRATQVSAVLPVLRASAAKTVLFMGNTFDDLEPLREAVGTARFALGFPGVFASFVYDKLFFKIFGYAQYTLVSVGAWVPVFSDAGLETEYERDMPGWLRTHAVLSVVVASICATAKAREGGLTWREAKGGVRALREGFALVQKLGHALNPPGLATLARASDATVATTLWGMSRLAFARDMLGRDLSESRSLIDAMVAADPEHARQLRALAAAEGKVA